MAAAQEPTERRTRYANTDSIPRPDEYRAVADRFQHGFDALEAMAWRLQALHERLEERQERAEEAPELVDIGALFSFTDDLEGQLQQCGEKLNDLKRLNSDLDNDRLNAAADQRAPQAA